MSRERERREAKGEEGALGKYNGELERVLVELRFSVLERAQVLATLMLTFFDRVI